MNTSQTAPNAKPALHGVKIKQRKSVQKAQAKHEPEIFRDSFLKPLNAAKPNDYDDLSQKLDVAGNTLDYRKYSDSLFEILIIGGILEPGGVIDEDAERSPFSIFTATDELDDVRKHVEVFNKLIRRYKYLQRSFEETLQNILQYINKWTPEENNKLATAVGFFITSQLASLSVLKTLLKDYLVKDGHSLQFVTATFKAILLDQSMDQLGRALISCGLDSRLIDLFPPNKKDEECLARHFEAEDMKPLVEFHQRNQRNSHKDEILDHMKEMVDNEASPQEFTAYIKGEIKNGLSEQDAIQMTWTAIIDNVDLLNARPDQIEQTVMGYLKEWVSVLETFSSSPKTEIILLQKVQLSCYENAKLTKFYRQIVTLLYKEDVVSDTAIVYWSEKGIKPQGKNVFLKQMEPFIKWLRDNAEDSEESDEE
ncbi:hypothetical protein INT44_007070 [Umbelopsis vinacea]|uniref:W2 domain-containing protein n=1 Tax=Umbelopsis vinacea TaxID=44442 RepID=A0A8H7PH19_9FUNG|nr:hypothetical protein INT44_007070 [Umbelopsis vinacea]KAI9280232.1 armadillo-type protein [Umbelopsis sp. AD052]